MKTPVIFSLMLSALLAGCGAPAGLPSAPASSFSSQSHPGWGQKTWTTLTVPDEVMGYAADEVRQIRKEFERSTTGTGTTRYRLRVEVTVVASHDGFKTSFRGSTQTPPESATGREFDLGQLPKGEVSYYLMVTAQAIAYDAANQFRGVSKVYAPRYVSNFGRNFRGEAR